jgi:hypothetical protein
VIAAHWPETIEPGRLADPSLHRAIADARTALIDALGLSDEDI